MYIMYMGSTRRPERTKERTRFKVRNAKCMACEGPTLTKSDPGGQKSLTDSDDWPAGAPGPGLSLQCTSAVSLPQQKTTA